MDIKELKSYIYENDYIEQLLMSIGCHHIKFHTLKQYYSCANKTGDNYGAINAFKNDNLTCVNYTKTMVKDKNNTDLLDLICYTLDIDFFNMLKFVCEQIGISYYHDFEENLPESFKVLKTIQDMDTNTQIKKEKPLVPISPKIISYYKPYVNDLFFNDNIDYQTQREFNIGYDMETNRITIPIYTAINDLVGVKGRLFQSEIKENENKYMYIEPCAKSKIIYGLHKTLPYIKHNNKIYLGEAEKFVLQLWSHGIYNTGATGGKYITQYQVDILSRLNCDIIICFDEDVKETELQELIDKFPSYIKVYFMYDKNNLLEEHQSPSDNMSAWKVLVKNNIYTMR